MKHFFTLLITLLAVSLSCGAEKVQIGDLYYNLDYSTKTAQVTYKNYVEYEDSWENRIENNNFIQGDLKIPSTVPYNGDIFTVTAISENAFFGCNLNNVEIPNSVTYIGDWAFSRINGNSGLQTVEFSNSLTYIGNYCFYETPVGTIILNYDSDNPDVEIGEQAFNFFNRGLIDPGEFPSEIIHIQNLNSYIENGDQWVRSCLNNNWRDYKNYEIKYFFNGTPIKNLVIPMGTRKIANSVFDRCYSLESVVFPDGVESIGNYAFNDCKNLSNVSLSNDIETIGNYAFAECRELYEVQFPDKLRYLGNGAFKGDISIYQIELPTSLETLGASAFENCTDLELVTLPEGVREIGNATFKNTRITSIQLPETLETIGTSAFEGVKLKDLKFPHNIRIIEDKAFYNCGLNFSHLSLPEGLECIGSQAFSGCDVHSLRLPSTLSSVGKEAFSGSTFTSLTIPSSMTQIPDGAFMGCPNLHIVKIPNSVTAIGREAFSGSNISEITLPTSMTEVTDGAFLGCANLAVVNLHYNITSIGKESFSNTAIRELTLSNNIISIGEKAFYGSQLVSITLPESLTTLNKNAFANTQLRTISLPPTLTTIEEGVFSGTPLVSIEIPDAVTTIGNNAIPAVKYIKLGKGFNAFSQHFFESAEVLEMSVTTPPTLPSDRLWFSPSMVLVPEGSANAYTSNNRWKDYNIVGRNAHTTGLIYLSHPGTLAEEIRIQSGQMPGEVTDIAIQGPMDETDFAILRSNMPACYAIDLSLVTNTVLPSGIFKGKTSLLDMKLPNNLEEIEAEAFADCSLMRATVPSNIKKIGESAFSNCASMDNDLVFTRLESIGTNAFNNTNISSVDLSALEDISWPQPVFQGCNNLTEIKLPSKLSFLPSDAFNGTNIVSLYIPGTTRLSNYAFRNCYGLKDVVFENGITSLPSYTFQNCTSLQHIVLPSNLSTIGSNTFDGCRSIAEIELPSGVQSVSDNMFNNCIGLLSVSIPESVIFIGSDAFYGCKGLEEISLPSSLTSLGSGAFANSGLTHISIPYGIKTLYSNTFDGSRIVYVDMEGVTHLAENAFAGCTDLMVINLPSTLTQVGERALDAVNLTAINAPLESPASTVGDPFPNVDNKACALSIPKPSFRNYLGAEYWGKFVSIRNSIDISMETTNSEGEIVDDTDDPAVELTYMEEDDYQEMLEELEEDDDTPAMSRRRALHILRANGIAGINKGYGRLFNNASLFLDENAETRFFLNLADDVTDFSVRYNGKDITNQVDRKTMSFVITGLYSSGNLEITTKGHKVSGGVTSGMGSIGAEPGYDENTPYYNLNGQIVKNPTPGIYIRGGKKVIVK